MPPDQMISLDLAVKVGGALVSSLALTVVAVFKILMSTKDKAAADAVTQLTERLKTEQEWRLQVERDRDSYRDIAWRSLRVGEQIVSPLESRR